MPSSKKKKRTPNRFYFPTPPQAFHRYFAHAQLSVFNAVISVANDCLNRSAIASLWSSVKQKTGVKRARQTSQVVPAQRILWLAIVLVSWATAAMLYNSLCTKYIGNNYFPTNTAIIPSALLLMYAGSTLQFGKKSRLARTFQELLYFFLVMSVLAYTTNAAQYTPFPIVDRSILHLETLTGFDLTVYLSRIQNHPILKQLLSIAYETLPYQMSLIPLTVIACGKFDRIREYYCLLLVSAFVGFTIYYFFPTVGPASILKNSYFSEAQRATGLKFYQIHHHIAPTTLAGGMIAFPSFHVIWSWFCLYLLRGWPFAFILLLPINLLLVCACVLLGWHYLIDVFAAVLVIALSHQVYRRVAGSLTGMPLASFKAC